MHALQRSTIATRSQRHTLHITSASLPAIPHKYINQPSLVENSHVTSSPSPTSHTTHTSTTSSSSWRRALITTRASASSASASTPAPQQHSDDTHRAIRLALYVAGWYAFNIIFNILNKSLLNVFPAPWFIATFQLCASALFMVSLWVTRLHPTPVISSNLLKALFPVAFFHTVGHVSACVSFSQMAVSFTHVIKAAEPVMSVVLAQAILGETYPYYVWLSLMPIIAGCSLAAMKEVSFSWGGFNNAMISNIGMVLRNIYSKKYLDEFKHIDGINMFALLSIMSIFITVPAALAMEGLVGGSYRWSVMAAAAAQSLGGWGGFFKLLAASGLFYHLYNQASYMVLGQGISPVTFSVGNTMKRVAVVASSIVFFKNPVSLMNWAGSMMALLGTGLYSAAKQKASEDAKKSAA